MALEGSLSDFGLADILQLIYFQRKTGVLALEGGIEKVKLFFIEGNICGAESKRRLDDNRLGKILLKKGLITDTDLQTALEEQRKTRAKLGNILIKMNLVEKEVLTEILGSQITETVIQLFGWKQGAYEFAAQGISQDRDFPFTLDTQHLLMDGLRLVDEWSAIKEKISLDAVFARTDADAGTLKGEEADIYRYVDGENDVSTIVDLSGNDNFQVSKTLVALLDGGFIKTTARVPVAAAVPETTAKKASPFLAYLPVAAIALSVFVSLGSMAGRQQDVFKKFRAAGSLEDLRNRIEMYRFEHAAYPQSLDLVSAGKDPWGRAFLYQVSNDGFSLFSAGPDGKEGTDDDIY